MTKVEIVFDDPCDTIYHTIIARVSYATRESIRKYMVRDIVEIVAHIFQQQNELLEVDKNV